MISTLSTIMSTAVDVIEMATTRRKHQITVQNTINPYCWSVSKSPYSKIIPGSIHFHVKTQ